MIGPHQDKELSLMLCGQKHLAVFHDVVQPSYDIPEEVIPEQAFAPHVAAGKLLRFSTDFVYNGHTLHYVYFTTPADAWRAHAFFWMKGEIFSGRRPKDDAYKYFIGRLLDYAESDIAHFLAHQASFRRTGS